MLSKGQGGDKDGRSRAQGRGGHNQGTRASDVSSHVAYCIESEIVFCFQTKFQNKIVNIVPLMMQ